MLNNTPGELRLAPTLILRSPSRVSPWAECARRRSAELFPNVIHNTKDVIHHDDERGIPIHYRRSEQLNN